MLNIAVDPALTFNLFRVFAALACIAISGFLLVYFAFGIRHPLTAIATALPIGLASTLLVSNLLAYVLGTPRALTWGLLATLGIAILVALGRRHLYKPTQPLSWQDGGLFIGAGILILILSTVNYAVYPVWDYYLHFWLANTIRFGNFPVMAPGAPMLHAEYHYGADFLAATLAHVGQVDSAIIFFILTPLAATAAYLAASVLAANVLRSTGLGLLAGLFFSFGAGLPYLIGPARSIHLRWFTPASAAAEDLLLDSLDSVSPNAFAAYPHYLTQPHYLIAWGILLSCIVLASHLNARSQSNGNTVTQWYYWIPLGVLFASVALIESSVFVLGLTGWGACEVWRTATQRQPRFIRNFIIAATPAALLALFQGGVFSALLFSAPQGDGGLRAAFDLSLILLPFQFGPPIQQISHAPPWIAIYLVFFGLPLLAAPALIIWAIRSKHSIPLSWLAVIGLIGMLLPHFVIYQYSTTLLRWIAFGHVSLALLLGIGVLTLQSQVRHRALGWALVLACAALSVGWPLATSIQNVATERGVVLGQSLEEHWTVSPLHRQSDHIDWISGRQYTFLMGANAREFLRSLPPTARVLTNRFPEVPLLIRGLSPHKNVDLFTYTNFRFPSPTYLDALYALDSSTMQQYGITHLVINLNWFRSTSPATQALLQNDRFFKLLFSDEEKLDAFAWNRIYEVLPTFYDERHPIAQDLLRDLPQLIPPNSSVYVSPAIPQDIRWAILYVLHERQLASDPTIGNHINKRIEIEEPQPNDRYDFALLIDEPPGERWLNWGFTPQDLPSSWGLDPSQRIWQTLSVGLYALNLRDCPTRSLASVPASRFLPGARPSTLNLDCLRPDAEVESDSLSLRLAILSPIASQVEIIANGSSHSIILEPGATLIPLTLPHAGQITLIPSEEIWVRAQRVPPASSKLRSGIPALHIIPAFNGKELTIDVYFYGTRTSPSEDQVAWEVVKQRRINGHWWHWASPIRQAEWLLALDEPPDHGSNFSFTLDFLSLEPRLSIDDRPALATAEGSLPLNPGEPYVLYFTLFRQRGKMQSLPVAWVTYTSEQKPKILLAPRFILLDQAFTQE